MSSKSPAIQIEINIPASLDQPSKPVDSEVKIGVIRSFIVQEHLGPGFGSYGDLR
jgi:hypothetical protein